MIGLIWAHETGRAHASRLAEALPGQCRLFDGPVREQLAAAWDTSDGIVAFLATGATVRLIAPLLTGKHIDPGVVCVDAGRRFAVALTGGHEGGANQLAERVAAVFGAQPVITTAAEAAAQIDHSLVIGVGASRGVSADEIGELLDRELAERGLTGAMVRCLASADVKAEEPGLLAFARQRGWPLITHAAADLAAVVVPNPSEVVRAAVGTPSVAEAAALLTGGAGATLIAPKAASAQATVAIARVAAAPAGKRGRLAIVGLGPGAADLRTPRAAEELRRAEIVVGLDQYLDQVRELLRPDVRVYSSGLGAESERARTAVELAEQGHAVVLVGSGDAGVYAMASPALEFATDRIDVSVVPGVTAALAAGALLGAPLGNDHMYLSLSDLHTPWEVIERRLQAAATADLVVCLYNPRSGRRTRQLPRALQILAGHRPPDTPVGLVRNATRPGQRVRLTTLDACDPAEVDMMTLVVVGASTTRMIAGRMVTPRGYTWLQ